MGSVFIAGGTGYVGRTLSAELLQRGHEVRALVRPGSERNTAPGCRLIHGDALSRQTYVHSIPPSETFVELVGVAKPNPLKGEQFRRIDLVAGLEAVRAAKDAGVRHFIYVSVAHPAPVMKAYIAVRAEVEAAIVDAGLNATILRPWYVLGPGHWWPYALKPIYKAAEMVPSTREGAQRLGLVTLAEMVAAMAHVVDDPAHGVRVVTVPEIRQIATQKVRKAAA